MSGTVVRAVALWVLAPWSLAHAALPDDNPRSWEVGTGLVKRLAALPDAHLVVGVTGDGKVFALDTETWELDTRAPCTVRSAAIEQESSSSTRFVYVGCDDGWVRTFQWTGTKLAAWSGTGTVSEVQIAKNPLVGLWMGGDGVLYGLAEGSGSVLRLQDVDPRTGALDAFPELIELSSRDFVDAALRPDVYGSGEMLYVAHGSRKFSYINLTTRIAPTTFGASQAVDAEDVVLVPQSIAQAGSLAVYVADADRGLVTWNGSAAGGVRGSPFQYIGSGLSGAKAVGTSTISSGAAEGLLLFRQGAVEVYDIVNTVPAGTNAVATIDVDGTVADLIEGEPGYVLAGGDGGRLHLLTAYPFADPVTLEPAVGEAGTEVQASFTPRSSGTWSLRRGGQRTGGGVELASGDAVADQRVSVTFTVDTAFAEGENDLWVVLDNGAQIGGVKGVFTVDNPPAMVDLGEGSVGFGDGAIVLDFFGVDSADVASYAVYVSTEPFLRRDWPTGGPTSSASGSTTDTDATTAVSGIDSPVSIAAPEDGARVQYRISGLSNYVTYYLAVRAIDADGTEGPMSRVVSEMPRPTYNVGEILGEDGGAAGCDVRGGSAGFGAAAWLGFAALARRRRGLALAAALGVATASSAPAHAQDDERPNRSLSRFDRDTTSSWASFEFRHDFQQLQGDVLRNSFAPWVSTFRFEAGPQIFRVAELDFGFGFTTKKGFQLDPTTLERSDEEQRFQALPLSLGATARLHILDEQPIVPYAGAGIDWVFYRVDEIASGDTGVTVDKSARLTGSKKGWHYQVGGNILLDALAPTRAAQLEATTGINDTWLTIEYRAQQVGKGTPLDLSGWALSVGLKMDY
jgi:hypothetical protein